MGCYAGRPDDDNWATEDTKTSLAKFAKFAKFPRRLTIPMLTFLIQLADPRTGFAPLSVWQV